MEPRRSLAGFTVIEIVLVLVVCLIGALAFSAYFGGHRESLVASPEDRRASELAEATTQRLLATPGSDAALAAGEHVDAANPHERQYYVSWTVDDREPIASCKRITVTVRWPSVDADHRVRLVAVTPATR